MTYFESYEEQEGSDYFGEVCIGLKKSSLLYDTEEFDTKRR